MHDDGDRGSEKILFADLTVALQFVHGILRIKTISCIVINMAVNDTTHLPACIRPALISWIQLLVNFIEFSIP